MFGPLLDVQMSKKCTPVWREAHFEVKMLKAPPVRTTFGRSDAVFRDRRKGLCTLWKVTKMWGFCRSFKNDGRHGTFEEIWKDAFRVAGAVQETCSSEMLGGQGADFLRGGCILEHKIFSFGKMILRDRCSTLYDLASFFRGRRSTLDRSGEIAPAAATNTQTSKEFRESSLAVSQPGLSYMYCVLECMCADVSGWCGCLWLPSVGPSRLSWARPFWPCLCPCASFASFSLWALSHVLLLLLQILQHVAVVLLVHEAARKLP